MSNKLLAQEVVKKVEPRMIILKLLEEMSELSEVLLKSLTKPDTLKPSLDKIVEETGDVSVRLNIYKELIGADLVDKRIEEKEQNIAKYINKL